MWQKNIFALTLMVLISSTLTSCLEDIKTDTGQLVNSMGDMNNNMSSIATSLSEMQITADQALTDLNKTIENFENNFAVGVEKIQDMSDSLLKLDRLFEMADYVKKMSDNLEGLTGTLEKFESLSNEALKVLQNLDLGFQPTETETNIENFISDDEQDEIDELLGGEL